MAQDESNRTDRRKFLQAGAAASAGALCLSTGSNAQEAANDAAPLPRRVLGRTGIEVPILELGGGRSERIMRQAFASGIRLFDTAKLYGTEILFKRWFEQSPEIREQIVLVTKDLPKKPSQMLKMVDQRLAALGTDYIDIFFIHGFGDEHKLDVAIDFIKGKEFKETADAIRKSGKARFIGFSSHHRNRAQLIEAAAEGGIVDVVMLQYAPWLAKDSPLNKALDVAHKKGIGLISMKQIASHGFGDAPKGNILEDVVKRVPALRERGLTPYGGLLHAIWTDERISASCVSMRNTDQLRQNVDAARRYEPLKTADILQLRDALLDHGPTMCASCEGQCSLAAGTQAELGNITRFLTYYEHLGDRARARHEYARLSEEARHWSGADLDAAREVCPNRLDFASLLKRAKKHLA
jgi:aryl-alcohol dehydrogenase-like predicted oxidoreductase